MLKVLDKSEIMNILSNYIDSLKTDINVQKAILYGSYAKGNANIDSDIDIAIFSDDFMDMEYFRAVETVYKHTRQFKKIDIEPVFFTYQEYIDDENPFIHEINKTGTVIYG